MSARPTLRPSHAVSYCAAYGSISVVRRPVGDKSMKEHEQLLDEARNFCNQTTGEVLERIPEEMMNRLRAAKLARGVPGRRNERTETYATWFVYLSDDIRDQVLGKWREANRLRRQRNAAATKAKLEPVAADPPSESRESSNRGLQEFLQRKKSAK